VKLYLKIWLAQVTFIFPLLIKYPLNNSLLGDLDTWEYLALYENIFNFLTSGSAYQVNYPFHPAVFHTDPVFLAGAVYQVTRIFTENVFVAWFAVFLFIFSSAAITGFLFSVSAYFWVNLDMLNGLLIAPSLLSFGFLFRYLNGKRSRDLILSIFFLGLQIYASTYFFILSVLIVSIITTLHLPAIFSSLRYKWFAVSVVLLLAMIAPMLWMYVFEPAGTATLSPFNPMDGIYFHSIKPHEFFESYKSHLSAFNFYESKSEYFEVMHFAFPGFVVLTLSVCYLLFINRYKARLLPFFIFGLIIAMGPFYKSEVGEILLPWYYMIKVIPFLQNLHHVSRGAVYMDLAIFLMAGLLLSKIRFSGFRYVSFGLALFIFFENFSVHLPVYTSSEVVKEKLQLQNLFEERKGSVVMNYPSCLSITSGKFYSQVKREYVYMFWQNYLYSHIANGYYFSLENNEKKVRDITFEVPTEEQVSVLKSRLKLNYILVHKSMVYDERDLQQINALKKVKKLKLESEDASFALYRLL
jgi:hypothetical protein